MATGRPSGLTTDTTTMQVANTLGAALRGWLPRQRWFSGKNTAVPPVREVAALRLPGQSFDSAPSIVVQPAQLEGTVPVVLLLVIQVADQLYQTPVTCYHYANDDLRAAFVGTCTVDAESVSAGIGTAELEPGNWWIYDGPHDPIFVQSWLSLLDGGRLRQDTHAFEATGVRHSDRVAADPWAPTKVNTSEQSHTSVIVTPDDAPAVMVKLFRALATGNNPEVVVPAALAEAGCHRIPSIVGWLHGTWSDPEYHEALVSAHLAVAAEYIPNGHDGWSLALEALEEGDAFSQASYELGSLTAEVHLRLAWALGRHTATDAERDQLVARLRSRVAWACDQVPELEQYREAALAGITAVTEHPHPMLVHHVHGDYHLGQVLWNSDRGWVVLDFEGEPLRPITERMTPDLPLRDIAGMLRSLDYAAGHATIHAANPATVGPTFQRWARRARSQVLAGYTDYLTRRNEPAQVDPVYLRALELDKALYEVVYEAHNRPEWLQIPLAAVARLTHDQ